MHKKAENKLNDKVKKTLTFNDIPAERVSVISGGERNPEIVELLSAEEKKREWNILCIIVWPEIDILSLTHDAN